MGRNCGTRKREGGCQSCFFTDGWLLHGFFLIKLTVSLGLTEFLHLSARATCFNGKYIETHKDVIKEFAEETMKSSEYVASRTAIYCADHYNIEDKLERINVPTLILAGDEDAFISPKEAELMRKKIKNSELKILSPKIGHMIQFEALEEYNKIAREFLEKLQ
jgi:pimeloyl-ACP methyl ester carboxylesterase